MAGLLLLSYQWSGDSVIPVTRPTGVIARIMLLVLPFFSTAGQTGLLLGPRVSDGFHLGRGPQQQAAAVLSCIGHVTRSKRKHAATTPGERHIVGASPSSWHACGR
jgi:hypothetical protein